MLQLSFKRYNINTVDGGDDDNSNDDDDDDDGIPLVLKGLTDLRDSAIGRGPDSVVRRMFCLWRYMIRMIS